MRTIRYVLALAYLSALFGARVALAEPGSIMVSKQAFFNQTSGSQPATASLWSFNAQVYNGGANDILSAQLTPPGGTPISMTGAVLLTLPTFPPPYYSTQAQLDAAYPNGNYNLAVTSGTLSGQSATLSMPDNSFYPAEVPFLTPSSFTNLEHYDPSQPLQLNWNSFAPDVRTTFPFVNFFIDDTSTSKQVFDVNTASNVSSFTSTTLPALTLSPNHQYEAVLVFSNEILTQNAYFGTYDSAIEKAYYTDIFFKTNTPFTAPEPNSLVLAALSAAGLFFVARRRKA